MNEATLAAVLMSAITMIGGTTALIVNAISNRKLAENDRLTIRDKLELDSKVAALEAHKDDCLERTTTLQDQINDCNEKHDTNDAICNVLRDRVSVAEQEWAELRGRLSAVEQKAQKALVPKEPH